MHESVTAFRNERLAAVMKQIAQPVEALPRLRENRVAARRFRGDLADHRIFFEQFHGNPARRIHLADGLILPEKWLNQAEFGFDFLAVIKRKRLRREPAFSHVNGEIKQFSNAVAARPDRRNNRRGQQFRKLRHVNFIALLARLVHDIEGVNQGEIQLFQLLRQIEVALQIRGVHHVNHDIRPLPEQIIAGDEFFHRIGRQAVHAGQIHDANIAAAMRRRPFNFLDGHARPIADALPRSGDGVEDGGFPRIRIAGQGDGQAAHAHEALAGLEMVSTRTVSASCQRSDRL